MVRRICPLKSFGFWAALLAMAACAAPDALAEDKNKKAVGDKSPINWVKICDVANVRTAKDGKIENKRVCVTNYERFIRETGQVLLSVAVREIEGQKARSLLISVPLGMTIPHGVLIQIDKKKPLKLGYSICHGGGCVAEAELTPELNADFTAGKELIIGVRDMTGKNRAFSVPLNGFADRLNGRAIDAKVYMAERRRQIELAKKAYAEAAKTQATKGKAAPKKK